MSEKEPYFSFTDGEKTIEARRDNASLFTFLGRAGLNLSMYDHVYIVDEEEQSGSYIFSAIPNFEVVKRYMLENGYPAHLNMPKVGEQDLQAFELFMQQQTQDISNGIPENWEEEK